MGGFLSRLTYSNKAFGIRWNTVTIQGLPNIDESQKSFSSIGRLVIEENLSGGISWSSDLESLPCKLTSTNAESSSPTQAILPD